MIIQKKCSLKKVCFRFWDRLQSCRVLQFQPTDLAGRCARLACTAGPVLDETPGATWGALKGVQDPETRRLRAGPDWHAEVCGECLEGEEPLASWLAVH
jgi:hypothetical protein